MRDYIIFLGNGGGRYITSKQILSTAGMLIHLGDATFYLDPGPGAIVKAREAGLDLGNIDAILCSHAHLDHYNDLEPIIEGSYLESRRKKILIAPPSVLGNAKGWDERIIRNYFLKYISRIITAKPKESVNIKGIDIIFSPTFHHEPYGVGFVFTYKNKKISYVSDSKYIEEFKHFHKHADVLIAHVVVKSEKECGRDCTHATIQDVIKMAQELEPRRLILRHFGYSIIKDGLDRIEKVKKSIEREWKGEVRVSRDNEVMFL